MTWPAGTFSVQYLNDSSDDPKSARPDLLAQADAINLMKNAFNAPDGVLGLDPIDARYTAEVAVLPPSSTGQMSLTGMAPNSTGNLTFTTVADSYGIFNVSAYPTRITPPLVQPKIRFINIFAYLDITVTTPPVSNTSLYLEIARNGVVQAAPAMKASVTLLSGVTENYSVMLKTPRLGIAGGQQLFIGYTGVTYYQIVISHADTQARLNAAGHAVVQVLG